MFLQTGHAGSTSCRKVIATASEARMRTTSRQEPNARSSAKTGAYSRMSRRMRERATLLEHEPPVQLVTTSATMQFASSHRRRSLCLLVRQSSRGLRSVQPTMPPIKSVVRRRKREMSPSTVRAGCYHHRRVKSRVATQRVRRSDQI